MVPGNDTLPQPGTLRSWMQIPQLCPLWPPRWDRYLKNWVLLLVGVRPKDTVKPTSGRRRDVLLAGNKKNTGDLPPKSVCLAVRVGTCVFVKGLRQENSAQR